MNIALYLEFLKKSFRQMTVYRMDAVIGLLQIVLSLVIQLSLWHALIGNSVVNGIDFTDMTNFVFINLIAGSLASSEIGSVLADKIYEGTIASDLVRPISLKYYLLFDNLGKNMYDVILRIIPVTLAALLFVDMKLPVNLTGFLLFLIAIINGVILINIIHYIIGMLVIWLKTSWYVSWYVSAIFGIFGGTFVPLWFYPAVLRDISQFLPFMLVTFQPIQIYLGKITVEASFGVILLQIAWIIALTLLEKFVWARAGKKIFVNGG